jgi:hypothetical protein
MTEAQQVLLKRIHERIAAHGFCVLFGYELAQLYSPEPRKLRELRDKYIAGIENFAAANGLSVEVRDFELNATFRKLKTV